MKLSLKILLRLLSLPFVIGLHLVAIARDLTKNIYEHMVYGSDWIAMNKQKKQSLYELFELVKKQREEK